MTMQATHEHLTATKKATAGAARTGFTTLEAHRGDS